jgi:hypothetical protein
MNRQNILNGKWFINFAKQGEVQSTGQIIGEAADGWFYVHFVNASLTVAERRLVPVTEMKTFSFYGSDTEMTRASREFGKRLLVRLPELDD